MLPAFHDFVWIFIAPIQIVCKLNLSGKGDLIKGSTKVAEANYALRISQEILHTGKSELPGLYNSVGEFTIIGAEPDISDGSQCILRLEDGTEIEIEIINYQWGNGSFTPIGNAIEQCLALA